MPKITKHGGASHEELAPPEPRAPVVQVPAPAPETVAKPPASAPRPVGAGVAVPVSGAPVAPLVARSGVAEVRPVSEDPQKAGK